jgi:dihydrofolate reductase
MNSLSKIVVSRSLDKAEWANTRIVKGDVAEEINVLKRQPGKDIAILGSSSLTVSLLQLGLVDELRIMVMPVVLGDGRSLFGTSDKRISLKLLKTRDFSSGNILLTYHPAAR